MKIKTNELTGVALDWAVATCEGLEIYLDDGVACLKGQPFDDNAHYWLPTQNWTQGGPIIEREGIEIKKGNPLYFPKGNENGDYYEPLWIAGKMHGQTQLIVAMRCYVASKLGDEVDIPSELKEAA